ncbi:hypothetical protein SAE02_75820 [Skermanella aerolata]|uniref:Uncharacterized protein n=1 Tax=Skermanella aerolata TaxID=393310 RepID=A0A512E3X9_9PROT|nr:hypothetical protein SAE02_75820 [Skermanella aerolata]
MLPIRKQPAPAVGEVPETPGSGGPNTIRPASTCRPAATAGPIIARSLSARPTGEMALDAESRGWSRCGLRLIGDMLLCARAEPEPFQMEHAMEEREEPDHG